MKTTRIVVIGAEHIGAALLPPLCRVLNYRSETYRLGRAMVLVVDPTQAESNMASLRKDFEDIDLAARQTHLDQGNVAELIPEKAVVFCCSPNMATVKVISDHCETLRNVTAIRGGCGFMQGVVQVFVRQKNKSITLPFTNRNHPEVSSPRDDDDPGPQTILTNCFVASVMLNAFHALLLDCIEEFDEEYIDVVSLQARSYNRRLKPSTTASDPCPRP
jgi:molybdopterin/thiamine biosynthesis adenylyltransferase